MILLDKSSSLELTLAAVPTSEAEFYVAYKNSEKGSLNIATGSSDGTADVVILALPDYSLTHVCYISVYNADAASITATVKINDTILIKKTLTTGQTMIYEDDWFVQ